MMCDTDFIVCDAPDCLGRATEELDVPGAGLRLLCEACFWEESERVEFLESLRARGFRGKDEELLYGPIER